MLVEKVLKVIPDNSRLSSFINMPSPIRDLIEDFNKAAINTDGVELVTGDTTGAELKNRIGLLPADAQLELINNYTANVEHIDQPLNYRRREEETETKHIKRFTIKTVIATGALLVALVICMNVYFYEKVDDKSTASIVSSVVGTTKDIVKFILGLK
jgi:hypothetical protein